MMKKILTPVLLPLSVIIDATLEGWKLAMLAQIKVVDPKKFIDLFTDSVDELRINIREQFEKVIGE